MIFLALSSVWSCFNSIPASNLHQNEFTTQSQAQNNPQIIEQHKSDKVWFGSKNAHQTHTRKDESKMQLNLHDTTKSTHGCESEAPVFYVI